MQLSQEQLDRFEREGYLFFPSLFTPEEIALLNAEVPRLYAQRRPENVREKGSESVRTNFAAHMYSAPFARLARHPRMVEPVEQLFGEKLYMHQFKINGKNAFDGDVWQWHQDYGTWLNDDLMPDAARDERRDLPRRGQRVQRPADVHSGQPQARRARGRTRPHHHQLSAVDHRQRQHPHAGREGRRQGTAASSPRRAPPGSMMMFHSCLVHASTSNLSPWNRVIVYLSLCAVSNHIRRFKRAEWIAHRDFTPIEWLPDDCLRKEYPVALPWKDGTPASAAVTSETELKQAA